VAAMSAATLTDSLDNPQLVWSTGGNASWTAQSISTHDGVDAAQSGVVLDGQQSWIQTTVTGPAPLTFWWRVSSELNYDQFQFSIDGAEQINISGEVEWQSRSFDIPSGTHVLRWTYAKDPTESGGDDRAWLDQVSYVPPVDFAPIIDSSPSSQTVATGATVSLAVQGRGIPEPSYRWYFNGALLPFATSSSLTFSPVATNNTGSYVVVLSNYLGSATSSPAILVVKSIGDAVEAPELTWIVGGASGWFVQTNITHDGVDAVGSGSITNFEESWVQTSVHGPGSLSFWWRVSSEALYDGLQFLTNGVVAASLSGEATWELKTVAFPKGDHVLRWRYFKDGSITIGQDQGWLDQVTYVPNKPPAGLNLSYPPVANENDLITLNGSFLDPDLPEQHLLEIDWGDGSAMTVSNLPPGTLSFSYSHRYLDDNPTSTSTDTFSIRATVSDDAGSTIASGSIQVGNLAPVLGDLTISAVRFPGSPIAFSGTFTDTGAQDTHSLEWDWGDGSPFQTNVFAVGVTTFSANHTFVSGDRTFPIRITLRDDDSGTATITTNLFVMIPARPTIVSQRLLSGGRIELNFQGTSGANYQIQASDDLKTWATTAIRTAGTNGLFQWSSSDVLLFPHRFYRGFWQP